MKYILLFQIVILLISSTLADNEKSKTKTKLHTSRKGKILFPYPVNYAAETVDEINIYEAHNNRYNNNADNTNINNNLNKTESVKKEDINNRDSKYLFSSHRHSPIADLMMKTVGANYYPKNAGDPFDFLRDTYPLPKGYSSVLNEYDYIIIGGGSSGSVIASRLSEDKPRAMVLVIEAGKPEMVLTDIPAFTPFLQESDYAWQYSAEHQSGVCLGSEGERCFMPRGKALGGTSVISNMIYSRGLKEDWDNIARAGNYGWSYDEILKYFVKSEKADLKRIKNPRDHGEDGELGVENVPFRTGLVEAFLQAGRSNGLPTVDYNVDNKLGLGYIQNMAEKGHRVSSAKAFLHPHKRRKNLHIITEARALKIIIHSETKKAYAVEYLRNGIIYKARFRREVILSAGPIASPQILMLSGIGPQEHLASLGIPVIQNLQVGQSLYDHIAFPGVIFKLNSTNASLLENKMATVPSLVEWIHFGEGLLTAANAIEGYGLIKTRQSAEDSRPDIGLLDLGGSLNIDSGGPSLRNLGLTYEIYNQVFASLNGKDTWSAVPVLLHPKSKGRLELRGKNPLNNPKIFANYLIDQQDIDTLREGIKFVIKLSEADSFKKYSPELHLGTYPACKTVALGSDEYWNCAIRSLMISLSDHIATCKMGPPNDPDAVVDPELRVYGVNGIRVADASIIPTTMSGDMIAPAMLIGEKAADLIKNTWTRVVG